LLTSDLEYYEVDITELEDDYYFLIYEDEHPGQFLVYNEFHKFIFCEDGTLVEKITERVSLVKDKIILIFGGLY